MPSTGECLPDRSASFACEYKLLIKRVRSENRMRDSGKLEVDFTAKATISVEWHGRLEADSSTGLN